MFKSITGLLFILSICTPCVQLLLRGRNASPFLDLLSLICLAVTTAVLIYRARFSNKVILYPILAAGAVYLHFTNFYALRQAGDYVAFKLEQKRLERFVAELRLGGNSADLQVSFSDYRLPSVTGYEALADGTVLFKQGGDESGGFWGIAYSKTGKSPTLHGILLRHWRQLGPHWYRF